MSQLQKKRHIQLLKLTKGTEKEEKWVKKKEIDEIRNTLRKEIERGDKEHDDNKMYKHKKDVMHDE